MEFQLVVGDSPPIQDRETATEEVVVISHPEELTSKSEIKEHGDINANEHISGSSPVAGSPSLDEIKESDEGETSSVQVTGEAERASEVGIISTDELPRGETTPVVLKLANDHHTRQASMERESMERESSLDKVSVLYFLVM